MTTLRKLTLALVAILVVGLLTDTVVLITTGHRTVLTDDRAGTLGPAWLGTLNQLLLAVTIVLLVPIVLGERRRFAQAPAPARWAFPVLVTGLTALFVGTVVIYPLLKLTGTDGGPWLAASDAAATICLVALFGSCVVIGLATLRRNPLGLGARMLALIIPAGALTLVLGAIDPSWASPVLLTSAMLGGLALLGVRAERPAEVHAV